MLNDAKLRAAKPQAKPYKLTDSHRLYLLVTPSGGKLWRWNYVFGNKQKSLAFGAYPLISLIEARGMRDVARANLAEGRDPSIVRKMEVEANLRAAALTFEKVALEWHEALKGQWPATHANDVLRSLRRDIFPEIGKFPVAEIQPSTIFRALRAIEDRGSIETAKRDFVDAASSPMWLAHEYPQIATGFGRPVARYRTGVMRLLFAFAALPSLSEDEARRHWLTVHGPVIRWVLSASRLFGGVRKSPVASTFFQ